MPHYAANISTLVGDHACNLLLIRLVQNRISIELALALGCYRSQDVALERVTAFDLASACLVETLRRSAMCFQLGHSVFLLQHTIRDFSYSRAGEPSSIGNCAAPEGAQL